jgi:hypothetical protein
LHIPPPKDPRRFPIKIKSGALVTATPTPTRTCIVMLLLLQSKKKNKKSGKEKKKKTRFEFSTSSLFSLLSPERHTSSPLQGKMELDDPTESTPEKVNGDEQLS